MMHYVTITNKGVTESYRFPTKELKDEFMGNIKDCIKGNVNCVVYISGHKEILLTQGYLKDSLISTINL